MSDTTNGASAVQPYAIVEASGQQFWLQPNRYVDLDRLSADVDDSVTIDQVLLVNDGTTITLGQPFVKGASVTLKVLAHRRGTKVIVYKMRPKKKTRRKNGHRQELTRVMVESIKLAGQVLA
jgi:large subunit ribosomal protein L21